MSTAELRKLKIVPFSGTDYSLGEGLSDPHGTTTKDAVAISTRLALVFQWHEKSVVRLVLPTSSGQSLSCNLSYDADELEPTEIYLTLEDRSQAQLLRSLKVAVARIELFRTCFELQAEVLAVNEEGESNHWDLVLGVPTSMTTIKQRRLPRRELSDEERSKLPKLTWSREGAAPCEMKVIQMSLTALVVEMRETFVPGTCKILAGENSFNAECISSGGERAIFLMRWTDPIQYGNYFDLYRLIAFPDLVERSELNYSELFDLYVETGYLSQFCAGETLDDRRSLLIGTWKLLEKSNHIESADYLTTEGDGAKPTGCSSLARAFRAGESDYWVYHQLCSKKTPSTLQSSGHLYTWRAEYLAAYPGPLKSIVWFRSASRWLERIYVKFTKQCKGKSALTPVRLVKGPVQLSSASEVLELKGKVDRAETMDRVLFEGNDWFAGMGPEYLNASGLLNMVVANGAKELPNLSVVASKLLDLNGRRNAELYVSMDISHELSDETFKTMPSDRLAQIEKADLLDFVASVEHSIAVTARKQK